MRIGTKQQWHQHCRDTFRLVRLVCNRSVDLGQNLTLIRWSNAGLNADWIIPDIDCGNATMGSNAHRINSIIKEEREKNCINRNCGSEWVGIGGGGGGGGGRGGTGRSGVSLLHLSPIQSAWLSVSKVNSLNWYPTPASFHPLPTPLRHSPPTPTYVPPPHPLLKLKWI